MAGHIDSIITGRQAILQSVKSLETTVPTQAKGSGQQASGLPRDLVESLSAVQTSVQQITESSGKVLQVINRDFASLMMTAE